jgi:hypothetical protein
MRRAGQVLLRLRQGLPGHQTRGRGIDPLRRLACWYLLRGYCGDITVDLDAIEAELHDLRAMRQRDWWTIARLRQQLIMLRLRALTTVGKW